MMRKLFFFILVAAASVVCLPVLAATPRPIKFPAVPGLTVRQVGSSVTVLWGKPSKTVKTFDGYTLFRSEKLGKLGQDTAHLSKDVNNFTNASVVPGHTYYYSVRYYSRQPFTPANGRQAKIKVKTPVVVKSVVTPAAAKPVAVPKASTVPNQNPTSTKNLPPALPSVSAPASAQPGSSAASSPVAAVVTPPTDRPNIFSNTTPTVAPVIDAAASSSDIQRLTTLKQLQSSLAQYFSAQGVYPPGSGLVLGVSQADCINSDGWGASSNCPYPYFSNIPKDPGNSSYVYSASAGSYTITDTLQGTVNGLSGTIVATPSGITKK